MRVRSLSWMFISLRLEVPALAQGFAGLRKVKLPLVFFLALRSNVVPGTGLLLCTGPDGILLTDIASICLSWLEYYSNLFSACDYKLWARVLAGHLLHVLQSFIVLDQTWRVCGRFFGDFAFLRDLLDFTSETNTPSVILSLDRVDWMFACWVWLCASFISC